MGQYLYRRDERKRAQATIHRETKDEEDGVDVNEKGVGEVVEHVQERR